MKFKAVLATIFCIVTSANIAHATDTNSQWQQIEKQARGQTVYFYAWGGSPAVNQFIDNAAIQIKKEYDVTLKQVKVANIAETVQHIGAEKLAGKVENGGSADLLWINGENFRTLKQQNMLYGPLSNILPNWKLIDKSLPYEHDFTEPTEGYEAPWGVGQLVFIYDTDIIKNPPQSFAQLLTFAEKHPGKISYPQPPSFHGTSFLKAALIELSHNNPALYKPVSEADYAKITAPLWNYLDKLNAVAWRDGKKFPKSSAETIQLLDDGQLDLAITFNPNSVQSLIEEGKLTDTAKAYAFKAGALSNLHFLAIPKNSPHKQGALVVINYLMSPAAQLAKADPKIWGDPAILSKEVLAKSEKSDIAQGFELFPSLAEPHPSWQVALNKSWQERYGK